MPSKKKKKDNKDKELFIQEENGWKSLSKAEKTKLARLNMGTVLTKYTGSGGKGGTNDASAEYMAQIRDVFDRGKVKWQAAELGKVDQGGGGTIAFMLARYEMDVVDCGVGIMSMHAPYELAGKYDTYMTYKAYNAFYKL